MLHDPVMTDPRRGPLDHIFTDRNQSTAPVDDMTERFAVVEGVIHRLFQHEVLAIQTERAAERVKQDAA